MSCSHALDASVTSDSCARYLWDSHSAAQGAQMPGGVSLMVDGVGRNEPVQADEGALSG